MNKAIADPEGLEAYFTDVEHLRGAFNALVAAPSLPRRLLVIHGVGGVGKSSLLRMFRLHCKGARVAAALASGDEAKSALDVLSDWAADLKLDGVKLPDFAKALDLYRAIQAKVAEQARKSQDARGRLADIAGKAASKTAEAAAGAATGAAIGSILPGIGTAAGGVLGGILGGMGAEALVDWLRGFLARPDIDLLLDPAQKLTEDFLADTAGVAAKRRLVLMLDTFEQLTALEDWARDLAQRLAPNALLVIGGRTAPDWSRHWPGWLAHADVQELKPMSAEVMRELVGRYYATIRGDEPDAAQVEAITSFARGLPIVVTSAVRLWVQYGVEDFQAVKPQVVADLVDRLLEGVPAALVPALEAAATVRWFNKDVLRAVTGQADLNAVYDELRRFPFVRPRVEGLALHDAVREIIDESLRVHDPERHRELHERAAAYFEARLAKASGQEAERLGLERLYHRVCANESAGMQLFQELAEEFVCYRLFNRLRILLGEASTYTLELENSRLWREYYGASLAYADKRYTDAETKYQIIIETEKVEPLLRAYALSAWAKSRRRTRFITLPGGIQKMTEIIDRSNSLLPESDPKRIQNIFLLGEAHRRLENIERAREYYQKAIELYEQSSGIYGVATVYSSMREMYAIRGDWRNMLDARSAGIAYLSATAKESVLFGLLLGGWTVALALTGRYSEAERDGRRSQLIEQSHLQNDFYGLRGAGFAIGMQGRFQEADHFFTEIVQLVQGSSHFEEGRFLVFWAAVLLRQGNLQRACEKLQQSWSLRDKEQNEIGSPEIQYWFGLLSELRQEWLKSEQDYKICLAEEWTQRRRYYKCAALTGLVRVKHAQDDYAAIPPLLAEAEVLAQQYEYNDHLASLRLTQGHIAWDDRLPELGCGFDVALGHYQHALIYALRYNRFLLDEVLWGGGVATPLRSLIPHCQERGEEGRRMLAALRDWWRTGVNDIGVPRPDTISPIPEGIALLEAEGIAREREPGDGAPQRAVVERIEAAL